MSDATRRYLVAYDISDDRRRTRIAKTLQSYGVRVQYSVFLVDCRPARMMRLTTALASRIDVVEDSVLLCDLGLRSGLSTMSMSYLGNSRVEPASGPVVI